MPSRHSTPVADTVNEATPATPAPKRSATSPASTRPLAARTPPALNINEVSAGEKPRAGKYSACWVVAILPNSGGVVKTTRRAQKGMDRMICPSDDGSAATGGDPEGVAGPPSLHG